MMEQEKEMTLKVSSPITDVMVTGMAAGGMALGVALTKMGAAGLNEANTFGDKLEAAAYGTAGIFSFCWFTKLFVNTIWHTTQITVEK